MFSLSSIVAHCNALQHAQETAPTVSPSPVADNAAAGDSVAFAGIPESAPKRKKSRADIIDEMGEIEAHDVSMGESLTVGDWS